MDPPPAYTPRGIHTSLSPETSSIHSLAPSYSTLPRTPTATSPSLPPLERYRHWSQSRPANPTARAYHAVARRRMTVRAQEQGEILVAALSGESGVMRMRRKMDEEEKERRRGSEDGLVERAAEGDRVLERENERWDWLLAQMSDWEERDQNWKRFRREVRCGKGEQLATRFGVARS